MTTFLKQLTICKRLLALVFLWLPTEVIKLLLSKFVWSVKKDYNEDFDYVMDDTALNKEDYEESIYSLGYLKQCFRSRYLDISKEAHLGHKAPNPKVLSLDGKIQKSLLDFQKHGRPLVLSFGSCT